MNDPSTKPAHFRAAYRKRYQRILSVFAHHGFGTVIEKLQQRHPILHVHRAEPMDKAAGLTSAEHFQLALEELGPTFIKIGQFLTTRPDLLAPEFIHELTKLQDSVPPQPWEKIHAVLVSELGEEPEHIFSQIDPIPLAAASLAQVHPATLQGGESVVVKVQRPGIQETIETDLVILKDLAALAQHTDWGRRNQPEEIAEEFSLSLLNELDYTREGRNADRFRANFEGDNRLYIPKIYPEHSSRRVLVMERMEGIKIEDIQTLEAAGYDRKQVAVDAASCIVEEVLLHGFYHADPHGGNLIVMQGGVIGVMDFGMMGELRERERQSLTRLYISTISLDAEGMVDELMISSAVSAGVNRSRLVLDLDRLLQKYTGLTLRQMRFQEIMQDLTAVLQRHDLIIPSNLWMLMKTMAMMEGVGLKLDPDFNILAVSEPIVQELKWQMLLPGGNWGKALLRQGADWNDFIKLLPRASRRLLEKIEQDQPFNAELVNAGALMSGMGRLVNRLSLSMIVAALNISLAVLIAAATKGSPIQMLITTSFIGASILGIWLIISILRGK